MEGVQSIEAPRQIQYEAGVPRRMRMLSEFEVFGKAEAGMLYDVEWEIQLPSFSVRPCFQGSAKKGQNVGMAGREVV